MQIYRAHFFPHRAVKEGSQSPLAFARFKEVQRLGNKVSIASALCLALPWLGKAATNRSHLSEGLLACLSSGLYVSKIPRTV